MPSNIEVQKISADTNFLSFLFQYLTYRWSDAEAGLIGNCVVYYPFGLNMPNLIFTVRKFVDTLRGYYEEHKSDDGLFPKNE